MGIHLHEHCADIYYDQYAYEHSHEHRSNIDAYSNGDSNTYAYRYSDDYSNTAGYRNTLIHTDRSILDTYSISNE